MEIKTCEQYVLSEIEKLLDRIEKLEQEIDRLEEDNFDLKILNKVLDHEVQKYKKRERADNLK